MWSAFVQEVPLHKGDMGLGFSILDYQDPQNPSESVIVVRSLIRGGAAAQSKALVPGDRLVYVNDTRLDNASLDAAVQALKGAPYGTVRLGIAKPVVEQEGEAKAEPKDEDEEVIWKKKKRCRYGTWLTSRARPTPRSARCWTSRTTPRRGATSATSGRTPSA